MKRLFKVAIFILLACTFFLVQPKFTFALVTSGPTNPFSFMASTGSRPGTITLSWYDDGTSNYNVQYGYKGGSYVFSAINLPHEKYKVSQFTIESLTPGMTYYFVLYGMHGDQVTSGPVKAVAAKASKTVPANKNDWSNPYNFYLTPGTTTGTVTINWWANDSADKYDIVYGTKAGEYLYGLQNMPYTVSVANAYTVGGLSPGKTYYFALVAERNNNVVAWTQPLSLTTR